MNFRNISAWSIRNPVVPIVLFIGLTLAGILSFARMDIVNQPDVEFPAVTVSISQPGAAPTEIENQVTQLVESAVRSINGVKNINSTASEGNSTTFIEFEIGIDANNAVNEVSNAIDQIRGSLPDGIIEPRVQKENVTGGGPLGIYAVEAKDMTLEQLSWFIDDTVAKRLLAVEGMAEVGRFGGVDREISVVLDLPKMQALGVTASQINGALRQTNIDAAGGRAQIAGSRQSVRILGNADDAFALSQTRIPLGDGRVIALGDVAKVSDGYSERTSISKVRGTEVVNFYISRARGASDVTVYDGAQDAIKQLKEENPGIKIIELTTSVDYTKDQYTSSIHAMIEGAVLAVIVVFLFLRDWRATLISALAIPLSAIPTFWFMDLLGFNLNFLSLLALGLVAGVLVDDAIVEIENIVRHMRMGKSAYQASIDAADEIGLAVVATTFSIVAVFLPVGLMPGISGEFFKNFGITVVVAVLISLAVARMITPMVAAYFIEAKGRASHGEGWLMDRYMGILRWSLDERNALRFRENGGIVRKFLSLFLDHRVWMTMIAGAALVMTVGLLMTIPQQFEPNVDSDDSRVMIEMVPGTTLEQTEAVADRVADILYAQPEVALALERVREGDATLYIDLKPDRARTSTEFERQTAPLLQNIPDARVSFGAQNGGGGGTGREISVMLTGSNAELLNKTASTLVQQMQALKTIQGPRIAADLKRPELIISPRTQLAASLGVTTAALSQAIRIATLGEIDQNSAKFSLSDRQIPIRVMLPQSSRESLSTIENLPVPMAAGGSVPLSRVADIRFGSGPTTIQRYNQQRRVFVGADLAPDVVTGTAYAEINALPIMTNLPQGVANEAFGAQEWQAELITNVIIAVIAGILLVFAVLVLLYKRFMSPLVNMGSLLLAPLGGLIALLIVGQPMSMPVYIGLLMLLGIVGKNSILLIDFALEEMHAGKEKFAAIMEAGHKRAQPIVMTTVAMTAGMVPTALSLGGDGAWRAPMGTTVIGGLILSTVLTLLIVPASFSLADSIEKRMGGWFGNILTYRPGDRERSLDPHYDGSRQQGEAGGVQPAE
ncbi:efflux RND transporter permease subunit [Novosphingopyxis sp.]|uniref:efflux RND transporter permease subunit n=1 Tax=Novosphingopyxis sp. TaxID=2709690 RepID=UPI003B5B435D